MPTGKNNKKAAAKAANKRERQPGFSNPVVDYVETLVDPYGHDPVHVPSPFPYRRTNVKEILQLNLKDYYVVGGGGAGECYIEIYPRIDDAVRISANNSEPNSQTGFQGSISGIAKRGQEVDPTSGNLTRRCLQPLHDYQELPGFRISTTSSITADLTWSVINAEPSTAAFQIETSVYAAGAWSALPLSGAFTEVKSTVQTITLPANMEAISFSVQMPTSANSVASSPYELAFALSSLTAPGAGCPNTVSVMSSHSMTLSDKVSDLESYGVTALAAIVTFEGSDLSNGGKVYSAVVPTDWQPTGDIVTAMSTIAFDRYDGPLKEGTHVHWFPSHLDELLMTTAAAVHPTSKKFVIYAQADDPTQSTRLRITQHQQYYSQSPAYGTMSYGSSSWSLSPALAWLVRTVPLCTSNDRHAIAKALRAVGGAAKSGLKFALEHPEVIESISAMLV